MGKIKNDQIYEMVTSKILDALDAGVVPWRQMWKEAADGRFPHNAVSGKNYHGSNVWLLGLTRFLDGYSSNGWVTFNQCKKSGGHVKRGEHGSFITFWKFLKVDRENKETGEKEIDTIPMLRYFTVFNLDQTAGCKLPAREIPVEHVSNPIEACENIVSGYAGAPLIRQGFNECSYSPGLDTVQMPFMDQFSKPGAYYESLFHELAHSTGHSERLARFDDTEAVFNHTREAYSYEELVAEMGSSFLCAIAGSELNIENSAAYISHWKTALEADQKLIIRAASAAQKAVDYITQEASE